MTDIDDWTQDIHAGDVHDTLAEMPASSVHMCMTSPPYYGLRDYGEDEQIGLEDSLDAYIDELVAVGDALRRVLRDDGSWWLNLGDSYCTRSRARKSNAEQDIANSDRGRDNEDYSPDSDDEAVYHNTSLQNHGHNFVDKDKMLVPHRVAIALQESGWVVRNDVTWAKPNPMPQSVKDRLNTTTEQIFHLTPQPDYWYDLDAIREPHQNNSVERRDRADTTRGGPDTYGQQEHTGFAGDDLNPAGKNPGDVFEVTTKPFPDAHFAVYPPELCEKPIKASCPPRVCAECGTPYERDKTEPERDYERGGEEWRNGANVGNPQRDHDGDWNYEAEFHGWTQPCDCDTDATEPGIVLDPFAGAGTTCLKAKDLGRRFIGIDLNPEYVALAQRRVGVTVDEPERLLDTDATTLDAYADGGNDD